MTDEWCLKRPFAQVATSKHFHLHASECDRVRAVLVRSLEEASDRGRGNRGPSSSPTSTMPVQASPSPFPTAFPSFTAVFDGGMERDPILSEESRDEYHHLSTQPAASTTSTASVAESSLCFDHRESVPSPTPSESTESSPTTTISTFDTTSVTDTSPSSSPGSPSSLPLFQPKSMTTPETPEIPERNLVVPPEQNVPLLPQQPMWNPARPVSPGRRARNLKNLSLRMPSQPSRPAISTAAVMETGSRHLSAPSSPVHRPIKTARRKPANLTIQTPGFDQCIFHAIADIVPPTPSVPRTLRHIESSPSLASIFSPTTAPPGGMVLPRPSTRDGVPIMPGGWQDDLSPWSSQGALQQVEEEDYNLDSRESTKQNERGYPDGPIQIYESGVYLYLEPTQEEASKFDVVVNVAKEVVNPFAAELTQSNTIVSNLRNPSPLKRHSIAEPMTAISEASFHSAFETLPDSDSPTTPKAEKRIPEYIHVPWDHNSEILEDLYPLCELVDDRVSQGKSVLIHCQLGASRSASLVVAYGLYKNRDLDFNTMYDIVKGKSRWVGPNMSLIYQLTDFRSRLQRGRLSKPAPVEWFKIEPHCHPERPAPASSATPPLNDTKRSGRRTPLQTLVPGQLLPLVTERPVANASATSMLAPLYWPKPEAPGKRCISPRPLPLREQYQTIDPLPRPSEVQQSEVRGTAHVRYPSVHMDLVMSDIPTSPSTLSPRAASFMSTSLSRTIAGDLAGHGPSASVAFGQPFFDPRSPPQRHEPLIMRSIDEFL